MNDYVIQVESHTREEDYWFTEKKEILSHKEDFIILTGCLSHQIGFTWSFPSVLRVIDRVILRVQASHELTEKFKYSRLCARARLRWNGNLLNCQKEHSLENCIDCARSKSYLSVNGKNQVGSLRFSFAGVYPFMQEKQIQELHDCTIAIELFHGLLTDLDSRKPLMIKVSEPFIIKL